MRRFSLLLALALGAACRAQLPAFLNGPVFGSKCGIHGADPALRTQIETLIHYRDTTGIFRWLREDDLVPQAYAAEAVIRLQREGMHIPARELAMVERLRRSRKKIQVCSGCSRWEEELREALKPSRSMNNIRE